MQRYFDNQEVLGKPLKEVDRQLYEQLEAKQDNKDKDIEVKLHGRAFSLMIQKRY